MRTSDRRRISSWILLPMIDLLIDAHGTTVCFDPDALRWSGTAAGRWAVLTDSGLPAPDEQILIKRYDGALPAGHDLLLKTLKRPVAGVRPFLSHVSHNKRHFYAYRLTPAYVNFAGLCADPAMPHTTLLTADRVQLLLATLLGALDEVKRQGFVHTGFGLESIDIDVETGRVLLTDLDQCRAAAGCATDPKSIQQRPWWTFFAHEQFRDIGMLHTSIVISIGFVLIRALTEARRRNRSANVTDVLRAQPALLVHLFELIERGDPSTFAEDGRLTGEPARRLISLQHRWRVLLGLMRGGQGLPSSEIRSFLDDFVVLADDAEPLVFPLDEVFDRPTPLAERLTAAVRAAPAAAAARFHRTPPVAPLRHAMLAPVGLESFIETVPPRVPVVAPSHVPTAAVSPPPAVARRAPSLPSVTARVPSPRPGAATRLNRGRLVRMATPLMALALAVVGISYVATTRWEAWLPVPPWSEASVRREIDGRRCVPPAGESACDPVRLALWHGNIQAWTGLYHDLGLPPPDQARIFEETVRLRLENGDVGASAAVNRAMKLPQIRVVAVNTAGSGWIEVANLGGAPQYMSQWMLSNGAGRYEFPPDLTLQPGESCRIYPSGGGLNSCGGKGVTPAGHGDVTISAPYFPVADAFSY